MARSGCTAQLSPYVLWKPPRGSLAPAATREAAFWYLALLLAVLVVGFVYEWKKGALDWE